MHTMNDHVTNDLAPAVQFHEEQAFEWSSKYGKGLFDQRAEKMLKTICRLGHLGETWLDAGCGSGVLSQRLLDLGINVAGVDASPAMVQVAVENVRSDEGPISVQFECIETIEDLSFASERFDGIVCSSVIEYLDSPRRCLDEFNRVLKEGGHVVLTVPHSRSLLRVLQAIVFKATSLLTKSPYPAYLIHSKNHYSKSSLVRLASSCGFEVVSIEYTSFWPSRFHLKLFGALMLGVLEKRTQG